MKKLSLIVAGALLLGGISFASPHIVKQVPKAPTAKPGPVKPVAKPSAKPTGKPASKPAVKHVAKPDLVKKAGK
jgi:hypothetical protein